MRRNILFSLLFLVSFACTVSAQHPVKFAPRFLAVDPNEGCDLADFDGDGKLDVIAGRNWYRNGDWLPRPVRNIEEWNTYLRTNGDWAYDVNEDGLPDVLSMDFTAGDVYWYENPGPEGLKLGLLWKARSLVDTQDKTNECCFLTDITGDEKPEWIANQWNKKSSMTIWSWTTKTEQVPVEEADGKKTVQQTVPALKGHRVGSVNAHGIGFGDINNDGRDDIVFGLGWYERPSGDPLAREWTYHADWDLHASCPMLVYDADQDGINDLVWSKGHKFGIYLWRGTGKEVDGQLQFDKSTIDESFSQAHCLHLADLDGDGTREMITGKRVLAHNGRDPGSSDPPIMRYYVWNAKTKHFDGYTINEGQVGAGLQIRTADLDSDGDTDIVVPGKEGTQILFNLRR